jgi:hypothetical protein
MTRLMACPPTCGAAAAILTSEAFAKKRGLRTGVRIAAQAMVTDYSSTFDTDDMMRVVGFDMARAAANRVFNGGLRFLKIARGNDNGSSSRGQPPSHAEPDASISAGHHGDLPAQVKQL